MGVLGLGGGAEVEDREGRDALAEVRAGGLAGLGGVAGDVEDVVGELEGDADALAVAGQDLDDLLVGAREHRAELAGGGDEGAGLVGDDGEVVLHRVVTGVGAHGLADLAGDQAGERAGLDADRLVAEVGDDLGRLGEEEVAGEDRDGVVPAGVRAGGAAVRAASSMTSSW